MQFFVSSLLASGSGISASKVSCNKWLQHVLPIAFIALLTGENFDWHIPLPLNHIFGGDSAFVYSLIGRHFHEELELKDNSIYIVVAW